MNAWKDQSKWTQEKCPACEGEFVKRHRLQRFCSDSCRMFTVNQKAHVYRDESVRLRRFMEQKCPNALRALLKEMDQGRQSGGSSSSSGSGDSSSGSRRDLAV